MESLNIYNNNNRFREYKYPVQVSAILMTEYIHDGYFSTEDIDAVLTAERQAALSTAMARLGARERLVLTAFANAAPGEPWLSELATAMRISPDRIRQIKDKALWRLRFYLNKTNKSELWVEMMTDEEEEV